MINNNLNIFCLKNVIFSICFLVRKCKLNIGYTREIMPTSAAIIPSNFETGDLIIFTAKANVLDIIRSSKANFWLYDFMYVSFSDKEIMQKLKDNNEDTLTIYQNEFYKLVGKF